MFCLCLMESERHSEGVCGVEGRHEAVKQELVSPPPPVAQGSRCSLPWAGAGDSGDVTPGSCDLLLSRAGTPTSHPGTPTPVGSHARGHQHDLGSGQ